MSRRPFEVEYASVRFDPRWKWLDHASDQCVLFEHRKPQQLPSGSYFSNYFFELWRLVFSEPEVLYLLRNDLPPKRPF